MLKPVIFTLLLVTLLIEQEIKTQSVVAGNKSRLPYRANFKSCCALGKQTANSTSESCNDYSRLIDNSGSCRYAFTICCNQNRRENECERGKKHAYSGHSCMELNKTSMMCDALTDCCHCCELGIQTRKNGDSCIAMPELNAECNYLFMDCCKYATSYDDCSNVQYCPSGQICENTRSGPICKCPNGFEKDSTAKHCVDIDECKFVPNLCPLGTTCQNTVGSYTCTRSCGIGYYLEPSANQCLDIDECATGIHDCADGMRCENYPGLFRCIREKPCGTGYSVNIFTQECDDIDECAQKVHDCAKGFTCQNLPGTYKCNQKECEAGFQFNFNIGDCEKIECNKGYELDENYKCIDTNECVVANPCSENEKCENLVGSYKCVFILVCDEGSQLNANRTECIDIDECKTGRHTCPSAATCINLQRSFKCVCPNGYRLDETRNSCEDIDECALGKVCPSNSYCRNSPGSFACECKQGFTLVSHLFLSCIDTDECLQTPGICDHKCVNTYGSYQCTCNEGYKLGPDRRTCVDIDECSLQQSICAGICTNTPGSYKCSCPPGFALDKLGRFCEDLNECELNTHNCTTNKDICVNTRGSFQCLKVECPDGYTLISDLRNSRCDRAHVICKYGDLECLRKPMKIFYSHATFSYLVPVPIKIFTTRVSTYSRRIKFKYDLKLIKSDGNSLREDQFSVKQVDSNTFEIYLLEQCLAAENIQLDLRIEFYSDNQFSSCLLNKVFVYVTD